MASNSNNVLVLLVIIVVILTATFTWKALNQTIELPSMKIGSAKSGSVSQTVEPKIEIKASGMVGINIQPQGGGV